MPEYFRNPLRHVGIPPGAGLAEGSVMSDPFPPLGLLRRCPVAAPTPLRDMPLLAQAFDVGRLLLKDESLRMGLGSFKALGAAYVIARQALEWAGGDASDSELARSLAGTTYVCASAGNHGLSMAAGARLFGAKAVIYIAKTVPEAFARRLRAYGAEVVRRGCNYEESMCVAIEAADRNGWVLLSDSSWPGYVDLPARVMEGYLVMGAEVADEIDAPPTHVFLQAGVGGMAAAMAALIRNRWGDGPVVVVVEPEAAPALIGSVRAAKPVMASGPASCMGRLDCKEPSHLALGELARSADWFATITDGQGEETAGLLERHGIGTTPSGAAGVAGLQHAGAHRKGLALSEQSRVLAFISEGREAGIPAAGGSPDHGAG